MANFHFTVLCHATMYNWCIVYHSPYVLLLQSPYTYPTVFVHSFNMSKPHSLPLCMQFLMLTNPRRSQLVRRLSILRHHITHPPYHHQVISLQLCQVLFFHCPGLTAIENNTPDTWLENVNFCAQENTLEVSTDKCSLNVYPIASNSNHNAFPSTPPPALIISPEEQTMFTTSKDSLRTTTDSDVSPSSGLISPAH